MSVPQFQRGDIILAQTPHTDSAGQSLHPALIVGDPLANHQGDYVLIQITSSTWSGRSDFTLLNTDVEFPGTGLKHTSTFRCHKIFAMTETRARRKVGQAGPKTMREIEERLRALLSL